MIPVPVTHTHTHTHTQQAPKSKINEQHQIPVETEREITYSNTIVTIKFKNKSNSSFITYYYQIMPSNLPYKQTANVERRTWDKEAYEARAKARTAAEYNGSSVNQQHSSSSDGLKRKSLSSQNNEESSSSSLAVEKEEFRSAQTGSQGPMNSKRAFLRARREKVDLESKLGTSEIINPETAALSSTIDDSTSSGVSITDGVTKGVGGVGWHCKVCDCFLKDSLTYLDHINGRKHQRALGYSMRIAKSTTQEVVSKLDQLAQEQRLDEEKESLNGGKNSASGGVGDSTQENEFEAAVRKKDQEAEQRKAERKRRREERKKRIRQEAEGGQQASIATDQDGARGGAEGVPAVGEAGEEGPGEDEHDGGDVDPDLAAMMGFSGFA